jgi:hypothetical protein
MMSEIFYSVITRSKSSELVTQMDMYYMKIQSVLCDLL